jgi:hypothetical protein
MRRYEFRGHALSEVGVVPEILVYHRGDGQNTGAQIGGGAYALPKRDADSTIQRSIHWGTRRVPLVGGDARRGSGFVAFPNISEMTPLAQIKLQF